MNLKRKILLEICIGSVDDAITAAQSGADRLELNSAVSLGGLTPSLGTVKLLKQQVQLPIMAMLRPRSGGFAYSENDYQVMRFDADRLVESGADAIVFGILNSDGTIDSERSQKIIDQIRPIPAIFHRAFDVVPNVRDALEILIDLGFQRVMTSGQESTAYQGIPVIAELIHQSRSRIEILPAGGIDRFSLEDVITRTNCTQIHAGLRTTQPDASTSFRSHISFGSTIKSPEDRFDVTNGKAVQEIKERLD